MDGPCSSTPLVVHVLMVLSSTITACLTIWLAHRRKVADSERREFHTAVKNEFQMARGISDEARTAGTDSEGA